MVLGSWSGMRKFLEEEMLAECLNGHIRYSCTTYKGMDGWKVFEIYIDKKFLKRFSLETVNTYFIDNGYKEDNKPFGKMEYWTEFWELLEKTPISERSEYTDNEFCDALAEYRNQDVRKSINSENPIVRMFAVLDRRIGKKTLSKLKEEVELQPKWLQEFYLLRIKTENI